MSTPALPATTSAPLANGTCLICMASLPLGAPHCPRCHALCGADATSQVQAQDGLGQWPGASSVARAITDDEACQACTPVAGVAQGTGYLTRMVRGELGLGATFWQFQVLWPLLLVIALVLVDTILENWAFIVVGALCLSGFNLACLLGLWRAAARRPPGCQYGAAARAWVALSLVIGIANLLP